MADGDLELPPPPQEGGLPYKKHRGKKYKKISTPTLKKIIRNSTGEGSQKTKFLKYEPKLLFPEGWGGSIPKSLSGRGMDIFWINKLIRFSVCKTIRFSKSSVPFLLLCGLKIVWVKKIV